MRLRAFAVLALLACGDTTAATTEDAADECTPRTLDVFLHSEIDTCADATCNELAGPWHGLTPADTKYDLELSAQCIVTGSFEPEPGVMRWIFTACTGDQIPSSGVLALTSKPGATLSLPLTMGAPIELRYRIVADEFSYRTQHAWSLRDASDTPIAFHAEQDGRLDPWLTEPIALGVSRTDCIIDMECGGTTYQNRVEFRGDGPPITLGESNAGLFTHGGAVYDAFVYEANWGEGYQCGIVGVYGSYNLAFVAR